MESIEYFTTINTNSFKGKNVLITGATGGIGSKVTTTLIQLGANVIATTRKRENIRSALGKVEANKNFDFEIVNFENPMNIRQSFINIMKKFEGKLDMVIICHAIFKAGGIEDSSRVDFDHAININTRSIFHLISISTPFLKLSQGNIVIMSSLEAFIPVSTSLLNSISKVRALYNISLNITLHSLWLILL